MSALNVLAAAASALVLAAIVYFLLSPAKALRHRLRPYLMPSVESLTSRQASPIARVTGPILTAVLQGLGRFTASGAESTTLKLRRAGWYRGLDSTALLAAYRLSVFRSFALWLGASIAVGLLFQLTLPALFALVSLGVVIGISRQRGRLERAIESRRERMRIEIYTINQLLAMRVRAGGGVVQAVQAMVGRGRGEVVYELGDALRLHRAGWSAGDAFRRIAELTPEPFCGRTYRLLASAEERGADLARALLDLAEDVRESRRESMKRTATRRRAAMLIPTIAILAPVLILFVAAPLPYLITGWS